MNAGNLSSSAPEPTVTNDSSQPHPALLEELVAAAAEAARAGAAVIRAAAGTLTREAVSSKSSPSDWVTDIDRAAEAAIIEAIRARRHYDSILAEESGFTAQPGGDDHSAVEWIIDPLDGTVNFVYDYPAYAVAVGARVAGELAVGVVIDVARGETFVGRLGTTSTRNGVPINCSEPRGLADMLVGTGFNYRADWRAHQAHVVSAILREVKDIRRSGSAALDLCHVADGRLDGVYEAGTQPWDWSAATVIARGAGAIVGGHDDGEPPSRALVWACGPTVSGPFSELLRRLGAPLYELAT